MDSITNFFSKIYQWIISKISNDDDDIFNDNDFLPENFYDVYYHFKVLEKEGKLHGTKVGNFNYPDSFILTIPNTGYEIKIIKKDNSVFTNTYFDGKLTELSYLTYSNTVKAHLTYSSLDDAVYMIGIRARTVDI